MADHHDKDIFYDHLQIESVGRMNIKQKTLSDILKQGTDYLLALNYKEAIPLYEYALKLINEDPCSDDYDLYENDVCAIEYSLCLCYITQEYYFDKANEEFSPLLISYGKQFPTLYCAQAKLLLQQRLFDQAEKCINDGLEALLGIAVKGIFRTNWPGTNIQIPESDTDVLRKTLKSLKKYCAKRSTFSEFDTLSANSAHKTPNVKNAVLSNNQKLKSQMEEPRNYADDQPCKQEEVLLPLSPTEQNPVITEKVDIEVNSVSPATLVLDSQNEETSNNPFICYPYYPIVSTLKPDVPEFIPKSLILNSYEETPTPTTSIGSENVPTGLVEEKLKIKSMDKRSQTNVLKTLDKRIQIGAKTSNNGTQTAKREKDTCQKCIVQAKDNSNTIKRLEGENKGLQKKVKDLTETLDATKKLADAENQLCKDVAQKNSISTIRYEMKLSDQLKSYEMEKQNLTSMFIIHCVQTNDFQKLILTKHMDRCKSVINTLTQIQGFLTSTSMPTLMDARHNLELWKIELERTQVCFKAFQKYQDQVLSAFKTGNMSDLPEIPEFALNFDEPRNILQENFQSAVGQLVTELNHYQGLKKHHDEYYHWWNAYGRFMNHQHIPPLTKPPPPPPPSACPTIPVVGIARTPPITVPHHLVVTPHQQQMYPLFPVNRGLPTQLPQNIYTKVEAIPHIFPDMNESYPPKIVDITSSETRNLDIIKEDKQISETNHVANMPKQLEDVTTTQLNTNTTEVLNSTEIEKVYSSNKEAANFSEASNPFAADEMDIKMQAEKEECKGSDLKPENGVQYLKLEELKPIKLNDNVDEIFCLREDHVGDFDLHNEYSEGATTSVRTGILIDISDSLKSEEGPSKLNRDRVDQTSVSYSNLKKRYERELQNLKITKLNSPVRNTQHKLVIDNPATRNPTNVVNSNFVNLNKLLKTEDEAAQLNPSMKALGGPKFYSLFSYVKGKIPNSSETDVWNALTALKQKLGKLSGMTKDSIVAAVQNELISLMENTENPPAKVPWSKINNEPIQWEKDQQDTSCVICIEPFERMPVTTLKCEHKFHTNCIKKWFCTNCVCPVCRIHATMDEDYPPLGS